MDVFPGFFPFQQDNKKKSEKIFQYFLSHSNNELQLMANP
jgi:hypothetical protein